MRIIFKDPSEKPDCLTLFQTAHAVGHVIWVFDNQEHLCFTGIGETEKILSRINAFFPKARLSTVKEGNAALINAAEDFFRTGYVAEEFPAIICFGTPFQCEVWRSLSKMDAQERLSYAELAMKIGRPKAVRAVGSAVGANPVSPFIPCHRILPKSGGVGQYGWGAPMKQALLKSEKFIA